MNLTNMASHVCAKVRKTDAESLAICKDFINRAYENLWNEQLWRESLALLQVPLVPTTDALHAQGVVMLPRRSFANVIACRTSERAMDVAHYEELLSYDHDVFDDSGDPALFVLMRPVVHAFGTEGGYLTAQNSSAADDGAQVDFDYLTKGDAVLQSNVDSTLASAIALVSTDDPYCNKFAKEYFSLTKPTTSGAITITPVDIGADLIPSAAAYTYNALLGGWVYVITSLLEDGAQYRLSCNDGEAYYNIGGGLVAAANVDFTYSSPAVVYLKATDQTAASAVTATLQRLTAGDSIWTLTATETAVPLRQRIRLVEYPSSDGETLTVLGKREYMAMTDYSQPLLSWASNCLMDFAQADMLERDRQYAKAQAKRAEAVALLDRARRVETVQQAFRQRLVPRTEPDEFTNGGEESGKGYW